MIGSSGLVGNALVKELEKDFDVTGTYFEHKTENKMIHLDITDIAEVSHVIQSYQPHFIFLPAAAANVDLCQENKEFCWKINVDGIENVIREAKKTQSKVVFFSTDFIFDGVSGPYDECAIPNPLNYYGFTKVIGEAMVRQLEDALIVRTTVVYGNEKQGKNFAVKMISALNHGKEITAVSDQIGTPTYVVDLAQKTIKLAKMGLSGVYHIAGPELLNRYEFARYVAGVFDLDKSLIKSVSTKELQQKALRPMHAGLKTEKIVKTLGEKTTSVVDGLKAMLHESKR